MIPIIAEENRYLYTRRCPNNCPASKGWSRKPDSIAGLYDTFGPTYCPSCGGKLIVEFLPYTTFKCSKCELLISTDWNYCPRCGEKKES